MNSKKIGGIVLVVVLFIALIGSRAGMRRLARDYTGNLDRPTAATPKPQSNDWARELCGREMPSFVTQPATGLRGEPIGGGRTVPAGHLVEVRSSGVVVCQQGYLELCFRVTGGGGYRRLEACG